LSFITESDANALYPIHQAHAMQYVVKVRNRYLDKPDVYRYHPFIASSTDYFVTGCPFRVCRTFLGILANFNSAQPDYKKVLSDIAALFRDQANLLVEFACFFPVAEQDKVPNCAFYGGCRVSLKAGSVVSISRDPSISFVCFR
jgi:histone deacetylase complex regulatory component SIN3